MRKELARAAGRGSTVTYGHLMKVCRLPRGRRFSEVLGAVDVAEQMKGAPGFAAIVVRRDTNFPGGGYFCDDELPPSLRRPRTRSGDPRLSSTEKDHISRRQEVIWRFYAKVSA